jgi:hypothetical protein
MPASRQKRTLDRNRLRLALEPLGRRLRLDLELVLRAVVAVATEAADCVQGMLVDVEVGLVYC